MQGGQAGLGRWVCTVHQSFMVGRLGRSGLTFEVAASFDQSEVGKQLGLSCPWVHLRLG